MADYERYDNESGSGGFMMGLLTGTVLGAGLGMLLAPKAGSDLRGTLGEQARNLGSMASEQYRKATDSAGGWAEKGREVIDRARDAVQTRGDDQSRGYAGTSSGTTGSSGSSFGAGGGSSFGGSTGSSGNFGSTGTGGDFGRS